MHPKLYITKLLSATYMSYVVITCYTVYEKTKGRRNEGKFMRIHFEIVCNVGVRMLILQFENLA